MPGPCGDGLCTRLGVVDGRAWTPTDRPVADDVVDGVADAEGEGGEQDEAADVEVAEVPHPGMSLCFRRE